MLGTCRLAGLLVSIIEAQRAKPFEEGWRATATLIVNVPTFY